MSGTWSREALDTWWRVVRSRHQGARSCSHEPAAELPELGLGRPESAHRWTGTTCRVVLLDCYEWNKAEDVGRAGFDRVHGRDPRRTRPSRTTIQDELLGVYPSHFFSDFFTYSRDIPPFFRTHYFFFQPYYQRVVVLGILFIMESLALSGSLSFKILI